MRIKVNFSPNDTPVPNDLRHVNSWFHKCMGPDNEFHDSVSDYNLSGMCGGSTTDGGRSVNFNNGGYVIFSTKVMDIMNRFIMGTMTNPEFGFGMRVTGTEFVEEQLYDGYNHFKTTEFGLILKERTEDGKTHFVTINEEDFVEKVKAHIIHKFGTINKKLNFNGLDVKVAEHPGNKVRNVLVKGILNKSNVCQLTITCDRKVAKMIYEYGIGHSTGSGFGTVYKSENVSQYRKNQR